VKPRILLVDDEPNMRRSLRLLLADLEIELVDAEDGPAALEVLAEQEIHLVVTDLRMPGMDGLELLHRVRDRRPEVPVVILTAFGSIESAVDAIREGAFDYVTKPFREEELKLVIERALAVGTVLHENRLLRDEIVGRYDFSRIIGTSPAIVESLRLAGEVASADTTVLLHGESGTGKELFARAIHYNSSRRSGPFVAVNCAAIPDALLESELFGHERGAFTGADRRKPGRFEAADGGTLFLDEIGDMSAAVQAKWLRVLEDRSFQRLGGNERIEVDVRIVCATNHSLRDAVREGSFREDLFYRVTAYPVRLPPLRERRQDILPIARAVLAELAPAMGKRIRDFDDGREGPARGAPLAGERPRAPERGGAGRHPRARRSARGPGPLPRRGASRAGHRGAIGGSRGGPTARPPGEGPPAGGARARPDRAGAGAGRRQRHPGGASPRALPRDPALPGAEVRPRPRLTRRRPYCTTSAQARTARVTATVAPARNATSTSSSVSDGWW
jgi:two-component system response regulator AtoC